MNRLPSKGRLGGGLIAAAIGVNPYRSQFEAAMKVRGEMPDEAEGEDIDRGVFLEPALREWYSKKSGAMTVRVPGTESDPDLPWASYSADGIVAMPTQGDHGRVLEIKAPGEEAGLRYGTEDTDQVPPEVLVQGVWGVRLQWKLRGIDRCDFAALIDGKLKLFRYLRDIDLETEVFERAKFFMDRYVFGAGTPAISGNKADSEWLKAKFATHHEPALTWATMTDGQRIIVKNYLAAYSLAKTSEKSKEELTNALKFEVGVHEGIDLDGCDLPGAPKRIDWKQNRPTDVTDWEGLAGVLGATPEQVKQFTKPRDGARPFTPRFPKGK